MHKEELLRKYLAGTSSPQEEEILFRLLQQDKNEDYQHVSRGLWQKLGDDLSVDKERTERMYQQIVSQTGFDTPQKQHHYGWTIAASISVILLVASVVIYQFTSTDTLTVSTFYGEKQTVYLPDGSEVIVNANSQLSYPEMWSEDETREVWLEGEAYFKVSKKKASDDSRIKFIVHANDLDIQVLGTEFNVLNREEEVQVVLTEGKVHLQSDKAQVSLDMLPGEMVAYSTQNAILKKKEVQTEPYTAWTDGKYIFDNLSLQEIGRLIEHNYGQKVFFSDNSTHQKRMTATIPSTELKVLLRIIEETLGVAIRQTEDSIIIAASQPGEASE